METFRSEGYDVLQVTDLWTAVTSDLLIFLTGKSLYFYVDSTNVLMFLASKRDILKFIASNNNLLKFLASNRDLWTLDKVAY